MWQIIPKAIDFFTGKALEYEVLSDDDDDVFEDEDEDDDDENAFENVRFNYPS
jgi:nucleosome assembly protein 1-like 1